MNLEDVNVAIELLNRGFVLHFTGCLSDMYVELDERPNRSDAENCCWKTCRNERYSYWRVPDECVELLKVTRLAIPHPRDWTFATEGTERDSNYTYEELPVEGGRGTLIVTAPFRAPWLLQLPAPTTPAMPNTAQIQALIEVRGWLEKGWAVTPRARHEVTITSPALSGPEMIRLLRDHPEVELDRRHTNSQRLPMVHYGCCVSNAASEPLRACAKMLADSECWWTSLRDRLFAPYITIIAEDEEEPPEGFVCFAWKERPMWSSHFYITLNCNF